LDDQPPKAPSDAPSKTLPWLSGGITIREPVVESPAAVQASGKVASSSQPVIPWQPTFKLGKGPLPATASAIVWDKGEGGKVAQSLVHGLLLPEDIRFFSEGDKDSLVRRLQWHTIMVIRLSLLIHLLKYMKCSSVLTLVFAFPVCTDDPYPQ